MAHQLGRPELCGRRRGPHRRASGGFFELDNTGGSGTDAAPKTKKRVAEAPSNGKVQKRVADDEDGDVEPAPPIASKRAKR
jgi:hypothetical protein